MARLLECEILVPGRAPEGVFPFFADAFNLERITPPWLRFEVLTPAPIELRVGALIDYRLRLRGLPLRWRTRITRWEPPFAFEDTQLRGPYRLWAHTHTFEPCPGGTLVRDVVRYAVPGGALVEPLVRAELRRIFEYRSRTLAAHFGAAGVAGPVRFRTAACVAPRS